MLAAWAIKAWQKASGDRLSFEAVTEDSALIRLYWGPPRNGAYGAMRPIFVDGRRGAVVFIVPDTRGLGREIHERAQEDSLFRDTVVYLTCLHELGHAVGLLHTSDYDDIMYFFGYGGNIVNFFQRYRADLEVRADIGVRSGLRTNDVRRLRELYPDS